MRIRAILASGFAGILALGWLVSFIPAGSISAVQLLTAIGLAFASGMMALTFFLITASVVASLMAESYWERHARERRNK